MLFKGGKKILLALAGLAVAVLFYLGTSPAVLNNLTSQADEPRLQVIFLDVGQGDAALLITPSGRIALIDGGPDEKILGELNKILPWQERRLNWLILSHPHSDHLAGLVKVLNYYQVEQTAASGVLHTSMLYRDWLEQIKIKQIPLKILLAGEKIDLGDGVELSALYPKQSLAGQTTDNLNDSSLVLKLTYGQTAFLFPGDLETTGERELLAANLPLGAQVLKVGHHGSDDATSQEFLEAVSPQLAVISAGKNNSFGHPSLRVVNRLAKKGAQVWRTDLNGTIKIVSDGVNLTIGN